MVSVSFTVDPDLLKAAHLEANRRNKSVEEMVTEYLTSLARSGPTEGDNNNLIKLIHSSPLGDVGKLPTREEIYAERT